MLLVEKQCRRCLVTKDATQFSAHPRASDKLQPYCRQCAKETSRKWQLENRERAAALKKHHNLKKCYGLSLEQYNAMVKAALGQCEICGMNCKLFVDHNHETGNVRGLLCHYCNLVLGHARDDAEVLVKAIEYLKQRGSFDGRRTKAIPTRQTGSVSNHGPG